MQNITWSKNSLSDSYPNNDWRSCMVSLIDFKKELPDLPLVQLNMKTRTACLDKELEKKWEATKSPITLDLYEIGYVILHLARQTTSCNTLNSQSYVHRRDTTWSQDDWDLGLFGSVQAILCWLIPVWRNLIFPRQDRSSSPIKTLEPRWLQDQHFGLGAPPQALRRVSVSTTSRIMPLTKIYVRQLRHLLHNCEIFGLQ